MNSLLRCQKISYFVLPIAFADRHQMKIDMYVGDGLIHMVDLEPTIENVTDFNSHSGKILGISSEMLLCAKIVSLLKELYFLVM